MLTAPANVEVAVVEVAVMYPTVGDPVAAIELGPVQNAKVLVEPVPVCPEPPTQLPEIEKQPFVILNPFAAVVEPVLLILKIVVVAVPPVDEAIVKTLALVSPKLAEIASLAEGEEVPIPTFPVVFTFNAWTAEAFGKKPNEPPEAALNSMRPADIPIPYVLAEETPSLNRLHFKLAALPGVLFPYVPPNETFTGVAVI